MSPNVPFCTMEKNNLTAKQWLALELLVEGAQVKDVAADLKLSRHTISRWKRLPRFEEAMQRQYQRKKQAISRRMLDVASLSISCIERNLGKDSAYSEDDQLELAQTMLMNMQMDGPLRDLD